MFGASGGNVMQNVTNSMLHVRVCVPTMIPVISPAFVRAKRAISECCPLLLREDKPDMSEPQPFVKGGSRHHGVMNCSDNLTIADVKDTVVALIAQKAWGAPSKPVLCVPAMESTAQHTTTDAGGVHAC